MVYPKRLVHVPEGPTENCKPAPGPKEAGGSAPRPVGRFLPHLVQGTQGSLRHRQRPVRPASAWALTPKMT